MRVLLFNINYIHCSHVGLSLMCCCGSIPVILHTLYALIHTQLDACGSVESGTGSNAKHGGLMSVAATAQPTTSHATTP